MPKITREWLEILLEKLLDPELKLFVKDPVTYSLSINPHSNTVPRYLEYFKFIGYIYGTSIFHGLLIDPTLVPIIYPIIYSAGTQLTASEREALLKSSTDGKVIRYVIHFMVVLKQKLIIPLYQLPKTNQRDTHIQYI